MPCLESGIFRGYIVFIHLSMTFMSSSPHILVFPCVEKSLRSLIWRLAMIDKPAMHRVMRFKQSSLRLRASLQHKVWRIWHQHLDIFLSGSPKLVRGNQIEWTISPKTLKHWNSNTTNTRTLLRWFSWQTIWQNVHRSVRRTANKDPQVGSSYHYLSIIFPTTLSGIPRQPFFIPTLVVATSYVEHPPWRWMNYQAENTLPVINY